MYSVAVAGLTRFCRRASAKSMLSGLSSHLALATLIVIAFQLVFMAVGVSDFWRGELADADAYTRLQRVVELARTGDWYDNSWTLTNAPYGETTHYTRALDAILLAGAVIGAAVIDFDSALWIWGGVLSPVLLVLSMLVLRWGFHPLLEERAAFGLMTVLACAQPILATVFLVGRPDHHSLISFLFIAQLACIARLSGERDRDGCALTAGALGGLSIWVSVETLLAQSFVAITLALLWVADRKEAGPGLRAIRNYTVALFVAVSIALILERPPTQWMVPAVARISIVHWWISGLAALTWVSIGALEWVRHAAATRARRLLLVAAGGLVPVLGTLAIYPEFFSGPWSDFGPLVRAWLRVNLELQPLLPISVEYAKHFFLQLGPVIAALLFVLWRLPRASDRERRLYSVLLIGLLIFTPLALAQRRFAAYPQMLVLVPWALCLVRVWRWSGGMQIGGRLIPLRTVGFVVVLMSHMLIASGLALAQGGAGSGGGKDGPAACPWTRMAEFLSRRHVGGADDDILFTYVFIGSQMMWQTPYDVVGVPHGNEQALLDTHRIFDASADERARGVLARRGIDLILICSSDSEARAFHDVPADRTVLAQMERGDEPDYRISTAEGGPARTTFHTRLQDSRLPPWIRAVELPRDLAPFKLFRLASGRRS